MSAERATEAQAYVRALLAQKEPAYALKLESALNDKLIRRCRELSDFVCKVAHAGDDATIPAWRVLIPLTAEAQHLLGEEVPGEQAEALTHTAEG